MTPDQKAAFVIAQTEMMRVEMEIMRAENVERLRQNLAPANGPEQWAELNKRWEPILGYNALIQLFNS